MLEKNAGKATGTTGVAAAHPSSRRRLQSELQSHPGLGLRPGSMELNGRTSIRRQIEISLAKNIQAVGGPVRSKAGLANARVRCGQSQWQVRCWVKRISACHDAYDACSGCAPLAAVVSNRANCRSPRHHRCRRSSVIPATILTGSQSDRTSLALSSSISFARRANAHSKTSRNGSEMC